MPFDPEIPQQAPEPQIPPFDVALKELIEALGEAPAAQALVEGGASPREAVRAVKQVAATSPAPTPRYAHKPEVGAGGFGLPYMPPLAANPLAGEGEFGLGKDFTTPDERWLLDLVTRTRKHGESKEAMQKTFGVDIDSPEEMKRFAQDQGAMLPFGGVSGMPFSRKVLGAIGGTVAGMWPGEAGSAGDDAVKQLQKQLKEGGYYQGPIDGSMGPDTQKAKKAFDAAQQAREQSALEAARIKAQESGNAAELARANAAIEAARAAQKETERQQEAERIKNEQRGAGNTRMQDMEKNAGWFSKAVRDYSVPIGVALGFGAGMLTRGGTVKGSDYFSRQKAASGDATMRNALSPTPEVTAADLNSRVGAVNDFWRRGQRAPYAGGAPEVPYTVTPNTAPGVQANLNAPSSAALYQPNKLMGTAVDIGIPAAFIAESEIVRNRYGDPARAEVKEATAAAERDPSEVNLRRLRAALDNEAIAAGFENFGRLGAMGYGARSMKTQRNPTSPSAMPTAEAEQLAINDYLRRFSAPPPAPPAPPPAPVRTWQDQTRVNGRWGPHR